MGISWIKHKGMKILFADYSKLSGDKLMNVLDEIKLELKKVSSPIPILLDYTDAYLNNDFVNELKKVTKKYDPLIIKAASVGVTGMKKVIATAVNKISGLDKKFKFFNNLEEAKDYLCE